MVVAVMVMVVMAMDHGGGGGDVENDDQYLQYLIPFELSSPSNFVDPDHPHHDHPPQPWFEPGSSFIIAMIMILLSSLGLSLAQSGLSIKSFIVSNLLHCVSSPLGVAIGFKLNLRSLIQKLLDVGGVNVLVLVCFTHPKNVVLFI